MKQRTPIKRTAPPKRRNHKRHTKEWLRAYGSEERVGFVRELACAGCGMAGWWNENAHTSNGGRSRKGDYTTIAPLCSDFAHTPLLGCHTKYDRHLPPFDTEEARDKIRAAAAETERRWQEHKQQEAVA